MSNLSQLRGDVIPRSRNTCPTCEATPAGCRGLRALSGRYCCATCDTRGGHHDIDDDPPRAA